MSNPRSRSYTCWQEGPESPDSAACRAAVAAGGTQAFYDWHEVSLLTAAGRHREIIPDGRLCSAGRDKYRGLDLVRTDWPATRIAPGNLTITYHATAPHSNSNFEFYITRAGLEPLAAAAVVRPGPHQNVHQPEPDHVHQLDHPDPPADRPAHPVLHLAARGRQR